MKLGNLLAFTAANRKFYFISSIERLQSEHMRLDTCHWSYFMHSLFLLPQQWKDIFKNFIIARSKKYQGCLLADLTCTLFLCNLVSDNFCEIFVTVFFWWDFFVRIQIHSQNCIQSIDQSDNSSFKQIEDNLIFVD